MIIKLETSKRHNLEMDTETGRITGDTFLAKDWIKNNFNAKWDANSKSWVATTESISAKLNNAYWCKNFVMSSVEKTEKTISGTELVNGEYGFSMITYYTDGSSSKKFVG